MTIRLVAVDEHVLLRLGLSRVVATVGHHPGRRGRQRGGSRARRRRDPSQRCDHRRLPCRQRRHRPGPPAPRRQPDLGVVLLSAVSDDNLLYRALDAGLWTAASPRPPRSPPSSRHPPRGGCPHSFTAPGLSSALSRRRGQSRPAQPARAGGAVPHARRPEPADDRPAPAPSPRPRSRHTCPGCTASCGSTTAPRPDGHRQPGPTGSQWTPPDLPLAPSTLLQRNADRPPLPVRVFVAPCACSCASDQREAVIAAPGRRLPHRDEPARRRGASRPAGGDRFQITVSDHGIGPVLDDASGRDLRRRAVTAWSAAGTPAPEVRVRTGRGRRTRCPSDRRARSTAPRPGHVGGIGRRGGGEIEVDTVLGWRLAFRDADDVDAGGDRVRPDEVADGCRRRWSRRIPRKPADRAPPPRTGRSPSDQRP